MNAEIAQSAVLPYLEEEDFEQMRMDTRKLWLENEQLRRRIAHIEYCLLVHAWAGSKLH